MSRVGCCALLVAGALAAGCTVTRHGTLSLVPEGTVIAVEVGVDDEGVSVDGRNPDTGERLVGRLEKVSNTAESGATPAGPATPLPGGIDATSPAARRESELNVSGALNGDLGTVLRCMAVVERRLYLKGSGICKAEGAVGGATYRLRF